MAQAEIERLAAAHGQSGQGAIFRAGQHGVAPLDRRDQVLQQIFFKGGEGRGRLEGIGAGAVILARPAIGHDQNKGLGLAIGDEVVEQRVRGGESLPFGLVAANAMEQVQDRVFAILGISRGRVHIGLAAGPDRLGFVLDHLQLAAGNPVAAGHDTCRGFRVGLLVVRAQFDRASAGSGPSLTLGVEAARDKTGQQHRMDHLAHPKTPFSLVENPPTPPFGGSARASDTRLNKSNRVSKSFSPSERAIRSRTDFPARKARR